MYSSVIALSLVLLGCSWPAAAQETKPEKVYDELMVLNNQAIGMMNHFDVTPSDGTVVNNGRTPLVNTPNAFNPQQDTLIVPSGQDTEIVPWYPGYYADPNEWQQYFDSLPGERTDPWGAPVDDAPENSPPEIAPDFSESFSPGSC
jgi:hypothetical protein